MEDIGTPRQHVVYKITVSIGLGLIGFLIALCPMLVGDGDFQANLTLGFIFPMLITLAWGWRYGLLSATIGLGCQAPWFLWLYSSGYAPLVTVPLFTIWIVWHGWCREQYQQTTNALWHSFVVEIPFRLVEALVLYLVYPWVLQFNPAPWSSFEAPTVISLASTHLIVGKQFINAYVVLSVCEILLSFGFMRKALRLQVDPHAGTTSRTIGIALLFGAAYWLADTLLGLYVFQVGQGTFIDNLVTKAGPEEIAERMAVLLACALGGVVASRTIQKQRQMAEALEQFQRQFHGVFMAAGDAIFVQHVDGSIFEANPAACRLLGYSSNEMVSLNAEDIIAPEQLEMHKQTTETLLRNGEIFLESKYLRKDGIIVPVEVTANRFTLGDTTVILTISRDTTVRKEAEERLARSERVYREAIESALGVPYQLNRSTGTYDFIGAGIETLLGVSRDKLDQHTFTNMIIDWMPFGADAPADPQTYAADFWNAKITSWHADARIQTPSGKQKWISDVAMPIRDEMTGEVTGSIGILQDITTRKEIEAALRESERRLSTLMGNLPGMVYRCRNDADWTMLFVSEGCEAVCGYSPSDLIENRTLSWNDLIVEEDRQRLWDAIQAMVIQEKHFDINYQITHKSGEIRHIAERGVGVFSQDGKLIALEGFIEDITARRKIEQERERLIGELEAQNAELERFTYTVSHDLKSPLITIRGFAGMIGREIAKGEYQRIPEDLRRIETAADRMHQLLDELLQLSRIGRIVNPPVAVRLYDLAQEVVTMLSGPIAEKGIEVDISPDLPTVYGDEPRLLEVLQNLIENAVKFLGDQPAPKIEIGMRQDDEEEVYWVRDNGLGIDKRYHEKVFQLFDKLDSTSEGTGVGLALVKRIIEVHDGRVWVESDGAGTGSTFCFTLPHSEMEGADE